MLKLKIKLIFKILSIFILCTISLSQSIYVHNSDITSYSFVSSYLKHKKINNLYDYSFDFRIIKKNFELSSIYYMNKQVTNDNNSRSNDFNIFSFKYHFKMKNEYIIGMSYKIYSKYKQLDDFHSHSILLSKHFYSQESDLSYYPYIEYENSSKTSIIFSPNYIYLGCVIKDGDIFVEPFLRINSINDEKYSGIKLGLEL